MRGVGLFGTIGASLSLLLLLAVTPANAANGPVIYDDELVVGLPGPDALYDADEGQPQALLGEPRNVVFPGLGLPWAAERLAFRQQLYDQYGLTYAFGYQCSSRR